MATPSSEVNALLGTGSEFEGKLTFEGTVRLDGKFNGEIFSEDTLIIGNDARVEAEIEVATVIIYGTLTGNVTAKSCVELHAPAVLRGNIRAPQLVVDQGVLFDGNCHMASGRSDSRAAAIAPRVSEATAPLEAEDATVTNEPAIV